MKMIFWGHPSFLKVFIFPNISNESHQIRKNQNLSKPEDSLKVWGGPTTTPPFYTPWSGSSSPFPPCPVSRWPQALAEMLKTNTSLEKLVLYNNDIGDSGAQAPPLADGRGGGEGPRERQGSWRIGCRAWEVAILRHFWDVWNLIHLISISILVGFFWATFGV